jgi:ribosomal-protein-serine acetyltransferase
MRDLNLSNFPREILVDENILMRTFDSERAKDFIETVFSDILHLGKWLDWVQGLTKNDLNEWYEKSCLLSPNIHSVKLQMFFDNKLVGVVNTRQRYPEDKHIEIGYWLASFANGKGVVTRCAKTLIDLCFELSDTPYIEIACDEANLLSSAVANRLGFSLNREVIRTPHLLAETGVGQFYRLTREEWESKQ